MSSWLKNLFPPPAQTAPGGISGDADKKPPTQLDPAEESATYKKQGDAHLGKGSLEEAKACYQHAIALDPNYAKAHSNLGFVLKEQGIHDEAEQCLKTALSIDPNIADAHYMLGTISQLQGKLEDAIHHFRKALELDSDLEFAYRDLCYVLFQQGKIEEAKQVITKGIALHPGLPDFHFYLGNLHKLTGELDKAAASYGTALSIQPAYVEAHFNLGVVFQEQGHLSEAVASYQKAISINPDYADAHYNLGAVLFKNQSLLPESEASFRRALKLKPDFADAHDNLGLVLQKLGRMPEAEASYRRALEIKPDHAVAHLNLGNVLKEMSQLDEAEASYRRALQIKPDFAEAHSNLGNALKDMCRLDEARASYQRALQIKPDYADAHNNLLFTLNYHPDLSAEEIYQAYQEYDALRGFPLRTTWRMHSNDKNPDRRLRIGYVSPDFRRHACISFLEPLLAHHDKTRVEVYAYAELDKEDASTARYRSYVEHWIPTKGMSDEALAERIRSDGIDILVELAGHTANNRLLTFARKPAPVSLSWLGYGYTTGLSAIDYYLTDEICVPVGSEELFAEQPWRIATPAYIYRPTAGMGEINSLPAQERGYITFGTLTRSVRVNYRTIRVWAEILHAAPNSRLVMDSGNFKDPTMQEWMAARFAEYGIIRDRLEIGYHSPPWDVLRGIDIGLDCFPHNSGTTLFETLYMGVPYITLAGRPSVGRLGSSILQGIGHPEWIAGSEDDYVAKAIDLANDVMRLSETRSTLRDQMEKSPLRNEEGFARVVEAAYREMFGKWARRMSTEINRETNASMIARTLTVN